MVYSQGINKNGFYSEAKREFNQVQDYDRFISIQSLYEDSYSLVVETI